jgi:hypothetical protein
MKQYIIDEQTLLELLADSARLACLEWDGVDNWEWCMASRAEFVAEMLGVSIDEVHKQHLSFYAVAQSQLQFYKEI